MTALDGHSAPDSRDADSGAHEPNDAAGPLTGELPDEIVAEADISPDTTEAAVAAAIATAITAVVPVVAPVIAPPAVTPPPVNGAATPVVVAAAGVAQAALPQPLAGLVPARIDANGTVVPVVMTTPGAVQATDGQAVPTPVTTTAAATPTPATAQGTTPAPAATITLTLTSKDAQPPMVATPTTPAPASPGTTSATTAPVVPPSGPAAAPIVTPQTGSGHDAPPAATARESAAAPAPATPPAPAPGVGMGQAAPAPIQPSAPGGTALATGGLTTPHELAHELGTRVHMAVREGGRELLVNLRPKELGQLTIRVTMTDGVLHAQITADRPEAARMLQQSLGQLDTALTDLGYSLDGLDVSFGGRDAQDARSSSAGRDAPAHADEIDESETLTSTAPATHATTTSSRLDLLA